MLNIVLADDHTLVRTGIKGLLENIHDLNVVAEACSGNKRCRLRENINPTSCCWVSKCLELAG